MFHQISRRQISRRQISRRQLIRGTTGAVISLPFLEAMGLSQAAPQSQAKPPVRLVWLHTESGMWTPKYKPSSLGINFELTPTLEPLAPFKKQLTVLSGLFHANAFKRNPQAGRHVQDGMCHLTGADLAGTPGVSVRNTISVDQVAAESIGELTRIPVLNLSVDRNATMSFTGAGTPIPVEWDPRAVFNMLFSDGNPEAKSQAIARFERNRSILDDAMESTRQLNEKLGQQDRRTLDEYLTTLREVERRARVTRAWADKPAVQPPPGAKDPGPLPDKNLTAYVRLLLDMLVLALQTDQTRLATARIGFMGCRYPDIGCPDSYHGYSHTDNLKEKQDAMAKIDRHRIAHLAYFLDRLGKVKEGDQTLLDSCLIHYGAGMGMDHETTDLANLIVGTAGGAIKPAGHLDFKGQPLANLYLKMLRVAGIKATKFADSTASLETI